MSKSVNHEVVVVGVVYPGVDRFLKATLDSLERQSDTNFDLLVANDGLDDIDSFFEGRELSYHTVNVAGTHSSNRRVLIQRAIDEGYPKIIFADLDDMFEINRVQVVSNLLDKSSVVVNDSDIVDVRGNTKTPRYFSQRYSEGICISENDLRVGNMMGLANTAAQSEVFIDNQALAFGDAIAFDWYLWSSVLLNANAAMFTSKTATKYRVYSNNLAGLPQSLSLDYIRKGVEVKRQHYSLMRCLSDVYIEMADDFQHAREMLENKETEKIYLAALKANDIANHIWWENIKSPKEMGLK